MVDVGFVIECTLRCVHDAWKERITAASEQWSDDLSFTSERIHFERDICRNSEPEETSLPYYSDMLLIIYYRVLLDAVISKILRNISVHGRNFEELVHVSFLIKW